MSPADENQNSRSEVSESRRREILRGLGLDCCVLGGLVALGTGLWWERPSLALIVVGGLVFAMGVRRL